jgi:hypothetical protein
MGINTQIELRDSMDESPRPFILLWTEPKVATIDGETKSSPRDCY